MPCADARAQRGICKGVSHRPDPSGNGRPEGLVESVVTPPDYRPRGIGRALRQAALDRAWQANAHKVMLMTGHKRDAKGFYEALGFTLANNYAMSMRKP